MIVNFAEFLQVHYPIAQVHRHIYQSDGVDKVGCKGYLERLCGELSITLRSAESDAIAVVSFIVSIMGVAQAVVSAEAALTK